MISLAPVGSRTYNQQMGIDATLGHAQTVGEWMQSHWGSLARLGSPGIWFKPALINNILTGPGDREGELMH